MLCSCDQKIIGLDPCAIVIFGASGDLSARKLVPALFTLFCQGSLPESFTIVGASRTDLSDELFRNRLYEAVAGGGRDMGRWPEFAAKLFYFKVQYDSESSYLGLAEFLTALDGEHNTAGNRIFYLATPPNLYAPIGESLGKVGLAQEKSDGRGWARLVVEKPFGRDLKSAIKLDLTLDKYFAEHQLFRIDHYLAKETVQNILMLRFANTIFEPLWNRSYIDYVGIITSETLGVEHRAGYYEQAGVVRDMFQNHMMQLLALTSMEPPSLLTAERVRNEKIKIFRALQPLNGSGAVKMILGQYGAGVIGGQKVPGYRAEPAVAPQSCVPTFAMVRLFIDNWRWQGVPFYLASGKRLQEKMTKIIIQFKAVPHSMFKGLLSENIVANRLVIGVYPHEKISLRFEAKGKGPSLCLKPVAMEFLYDQEKKVSFDSYEKVLLDCIQGDHLLFWHQDGVELSWKFLDPFIDEGERACKDNLHTYSAGSWGPEPALPWMKLLVKDDGLVKSKGMAK